MINITAFIVIALATLWVSTILSSDGLVGPAGILAYIRARLGVRYDETNHPYASPGSLAEMVICPYCNSIWAGTIVTVAFLTFSLLGVPPMLVLTPMAAGGFVILVEKLRR